MNDLGYTLNLGHNGTACLQAYDLHMITVLHCGGYYHVRVRCCRCLLDKEKAIEEQIQLLRCQWYPVTTQQPCIVATIDVLKQFSELNFQSKVSQYDFYHTLLCLSDNSELYGTKVCDIFLFYAFYSKLILPSKKQYDEFLCMT